MAEERQELRKRTPPQTPPAATSRHQPPPQPPLWDLWDPVPLLSLSLRLWDPCLWDPWDLTSWEESLGRSEV